MGIARQFFVGAQHAAPSSSKVSPTCENRFAKVGTPNPPDPKQLSRGKGPAFRFTSTSPQGSQQSLGTDNEMIHSIELSPHNPCKINTYSHTRKCGFCIGL